MQNNTAKKLGEQNMLAKKIKVGAEILNRSVKGRSPTIRAAGPTNSTKSLVGPNNNSKY